MIELGQLRSALAQAPAYIAVHDATDLRITFVSDLMNRMLGGTAVGKTLVELAGAEIGDRQHALLRRVLETGEPWYAAGSEYDVGHLKEFGRDKAWFDYTYQPLFDDGKVAGVLVHATDVTEREMAVRAWKASHERLGQLISDVDAIVWEVDLETFDFSFVSDAAEEMTGHPIAQWYSKDFWSSIMHPDDREYAVQYCAESLKTQIDFEFDYRMIARDGRVLWIHDLVHVVRDANGEPTELRGLMLDVTERKAAQEERERIQASLLDVQRLESLGVLAGGIAHDFNNLLTAILGNASLVQLGLAPSHPARARIDAMVKATKRAADLTEKLLAYSGKGAFQMTPMDLSDHIRDTVDLLRTATSGRVQLQLDLKTDLPAVEADAAQLQQVFMNLVMNGAEALGEAGGTVLITTGAQTVDADYARALPGLELPHGEYVYAEVHDSGPGMSEDVQKRIFEPFFTTKTTGRGLGLAAVQGIMRGHEGAIRLYSTLGQGTTFKVFLPASSQTKRHITSEGDLPAVALEGLVLLVDDEEDVRVAGKFMLEHLGLEALLASDGREGVELFSKHQSELCAVILDMTMPGLNGEEVFREIRTISSAVPVILSSGYNELEATRRFTAKGLAGFLQKPYTLRQLASALSAARATTT